MVHTTAGTARGRCHFLLPELNRLGETGLICYHLGSYPVVSTTNALPAPRKSSRSFDS